MQHFASLNLQNLTTPLLSAVTVCWLRLSVARPLTDIVITVAISRVAGPPGHDG